MQPLVFLGTLVHSLVSIPLPLTPQPRKPTSRRFGRGTVLVLDQLPSLLSFFLNQQFLNGPFLSPRLRRVHPLPAWVSDALLLFYIFSFQMPSCPRDRVKPPGNSQLRHLYVCRGVVSVTHTNYGVSPRLVYIMYTMYVCFDPDIHGLFIYTYLHYTYLYRTTGSTVDYGCKQAASNSRTKDRFCLTLFSFTPYHPILHTFARSPEEIGRHVRTKICAKYGVLRTQYAYKVAKGRDASQKRWGKGRTVIGVGG